MRNKIAIVLLIGLVCAAGILVWRLQPAMILNDANRQLDVEGLYLGMGEQDVIGLVGEGEYVGGFGAHYRKYPDRGLTLVFPEDSDHRLNLKLGGIRFTEQAPADYAVYSVRIGDDMAAAVATLQANRFKPVEGRAGIYAKGDIWVELGGGSRVSSIALSPIATKKRETRPIEPLSLVNLPPCFSRAPSRSPAPGLAAHNKPPWRYRRRPSPSD